MNPVWEGTKRILVVDDEKNIRFTVVHALRSEGYEVDSASNGIEGLEIFNRKRIDLLLIDLRMPGMTGLEMLREIRRVSPESPPAVIVTAYGVPEQLLEAALLGAIDCVRKPFSIQMIRGQIRQVFERLALSELESTQTPETCLELGKKALMGGRRGDAGRWLHKAVDLDPQLLEARNFLGIRAILEHDVAASTGYFRTVLDIDPLNKTAGEYLAWLATQSG